MKCAMIDPVATGENLKELIISRNKKVKDVQDALGFASQAVYMWLHGDRVPTIHNLVMLADFLDVMVDDIIITRNKRQRRATMRDDLISRREVMDSLTNEYNRRFMAGDRGGLKMAWIEKAVDDVPPAQPKIIYCRECRNWIPGGITDKDDFIPPKCGKYQQMVGHANGDFCSLAERREE